MSPLDAKATSHPGWGQLSSKDDVAGVSRSSTTVTAIQAWTLLLSGNHLGNRQVPACRERVQEIWEGEWSLGHQQEHRDCFQPKVTSEGEAAVHAWQGQACCGIIWAASGLFLPWFKGPVKAFWAPPVWTVRAQQVTASALLLWTVAVFCLLALCCFIFLWHQSTQSLGGALGNYCKENKNASAFQDLENSQGKHTEIWGFSGLLYKV